MTLSYSQKIAKLEADFGIIEFSDPQHSGWSNPKFLDAMIELEVFNGANFSKFSTEIRSDPDCIAKAVSFKPSHLQKLPLQFATDTARDNDDIICHAFSVNPKNIQFASGRLRASPSFIERLASARSNMGHIAPFLSACVLSDRKLAMLLVASNNLNYLDLDETLRQDEDVTFSAMNARWEKSYEEIFSEAPFELTADIKFFDRCFTSALPGAYKSKTKVKSELKKLHVRAKAGIKDTKNLTGLTAKKN